MDKEERKESYSVTEIGQKAKSPGLLEAEMFSVAPNEAKSITPRAWISRDGQSSIECEFWVAAKHRDFGDVNQRC